MFFFCGQPRFMRFRFLTLSMMKKPIYYLLLSILCFLGGMRDLHAQDIYYSKERKFSFQNGDFEVVGWSGDRLYTYRASKEGFFLDAYNDSMRLMATVALDFFPQKIYETKFINYDDQLTVLFQAVQSNYVVQYAVRLDGRARMMQKPVALDSVKTGWFGPTKSYYSSVVSSDKGRIMIYGLGKAGKSGGLSTILLDKQLNVIGRSQPALDASISDFTLGQAILGNDGTLYLSGYTEGGSKGYGGEARILRLSPGAQTFQAGVLPLKELYISGMYIKLDDNKNEIYLSAFYALKKSGNIDGVIYGLYNPASDSMAIFKTIPFDAQMRSATDERNKKKAFNEFEVRNIIVKNDGGFILVAENFYMTTRTSYGPGYGGFYSGYYNYNYPGGNASVREYVYGDILVLNYDGEGNRQWHNFIRKEQYSQDDGGLFSSFGMINSGASLVFLYNDFTSSKSSLSLAALDVSGKLQLKKLNAGSGTDGDWLPRSGKQTDATELVVPVLRKNNLAFAKLAF